ncbi:hypothetical protein CANCADRAFT_32083 [Tortispora caseinolytica NRRL Y-17796]|uniref:Allantoin permease n=1 Tax=Tortispora caseinolytica NRRL Y-17796 TaxID=767744 RepID=A0A1E4T9W9_9ASCO|nr:hypothetical protein CANCADRAFT_32083 [Tortispora caseinolytica NRRL Y-17796]
MGFKSFVKRFELPATRLQNEDLLPTPPEKMTWTWFNFFMYWFSESWAISTWTLGSSLMTTGGMKTYECIICIFFTNLIISCIIVCNGRASAMYHIGFPVLGRVSFGIYGTYFIVIMRAMLGVIWTSVQMFFLGQFVTVILRVIFPSFYTMANHIPLNQNVTVQELTGFFIAFAITLPFMFIPHHKVRHLFSVKGAIVPFAGLGLVIWACKVNGGAGSPDALVNWTIRNSGTTTFAFSVLGQMNSIFGASSALVVTVPDLARYSNRPWAQVWGQILALPVAQTICASFGIITTSALYEYYGEAYWDLYTMFNGILDHSYTPASRAGVFFAAFFFAFATLGTSIACNIIPFAADVTCLWPRYINIIRGQFICILISLGTVPWKILRDATTFLNFLGGYSIFQGPVVGILVVDYVIRRGNIDINHLYHTQSDGPYWYKHGVNWRAIAAFVIGFALPFPGFCATLANSTGIAIGGFRLFNMGYFLSVVMGSLSYVGVCYFFRLPQVDFTAPIEVNAKMVMDFSTEEDPERASPAVDSKPEL